jgi:hypothetical protein
MIRPAKHPRLALKISHAAWTPGSALCVGETAYTFYFSSPAFFEYGFSIKVSKLALLSSC